MVSNSWIWIACIASICVTILPTCKSALALGIVPPTCLQCMCKIESRCSSNGCISGSGPTTCGYFGITEGYYNACGRPGNGWKECAADKYCSSLCVQHYMLNHRTNCAQDNCVSYARLHHGGPNGCRNPNTMQYALWVQNCVIDAESTV